jgi:hypothetical protein
MNRLSTSYERSGGELVKFGIGALGFLMGICGIIFNQPVLGILGVVVLLVTLATSLQRSAED